MFIRRSYGYSRLRRRAANAVSAGRLSVAVVGSGTVMDSMVMFSVPTGGYRHRRVRLYFIFAVETGKYHVAAFQQNLLISVPYSIALLHGERSVKSR